MPLAAGTRLGIYEITGTLGAGGMGEVYRARDTKLGREVAIKTLPSAMAKDADRLARFEREARLLAALNHAHIAAVYGLDAHEGTLFLAMELVEGETLEKKLKGGALPVEDAVRLALQIAGALEAAHSKGVVHRDLKPANIMLTRDGQAKVLDFGLAKAFSGVAGEASPAHSPALSLAMTQQGLVLGTAGYMSPEQASGQATDQRGDVWAFGVVLYEMLTGLPVFKGESVPHILADVLKTEPDWSRLPKNLHPRIKAVLERCLTKKPHSRLHSIADARIEIEAVLSDPHGVTPAPASDAGIPKSSRVLRLAGTAAVAAALAGAAGWVLRPLPAPEPKTIVRFSVPLPAEPSFPANSISIIAVSPDGQQIAYSAAGQVFLRNIGEREARPVQGTAETGLGALSPAFSPDGQWLAYVDVRAFAGPYVVKRIPISGGPPETIHEQEAGTDFPHGLSWPTPDTILFTNADGIIRISPNGGAHEVLVPRGQDERLFSPQLLPAGDAVLFTRAAGTPGATLGGLDTAQVVVQSIGGDDRTVIREGGSAARYLPTGHLIYAEGTALFAMPFDPETRTVPGGPVRVLDALRRSAIGLSDTAYFDVSQTGTLVTVPEGPNAEARIETTLTWVGRDGREEPFPARPGNYTMVRISPDGTNVALVLGSPLGDTQADIWIFDQRTENLSQLTTDPAGDDGPVWSADGNRIFFRSVRGTTQGVYAIDVDTGETTLRAPSSPEFPQPLPWTISPDGRTLGLVNTTSDFNIATLSLADSGELTHLLQDAEVSESQPSFSPNGAWIAYQEGDATFEINIRPFPDVSRRRIPVGRGNSAVFSRDGSELFFQSGDSLVAVSISYEPTIRVGPPTRLFETTAYSLNAPGRAWDVDANGERFLMIRAPAAGEAGGAQPTARIDVVLNWFEELESRVPVE